MVKGARFGANEKSQARDKKRRKEGLCVKCGEEKVEDTLNCRKCLDKKAEQRKMNKKYEWGDDVEGTCLNCAGRGRKVHLEYQGDDEVMCMVCSKIFKISEIKK